MKKLIRTSTVAISLNGLLKGQLKYLNNYYDVIAVSGGDEHLKQVAIREEVLIRDIKMARQINIYRDLVSLIKLIRLFRKENPQIVHSITPKAGLLSMLAARFTRVPIRIHTFTGLIFPSKTGLFQKILILMDRLLCACATNIYPEGEGVKNDLIKYRITSKPLKVIGNGNVNGIDTAFFHPEIVTREQKSTLRAQLGIQDSDFVFVFVGRLVKDKGINELVAAFKAVQTKYPQTKLLLVGQFEEDLDPLLPETMQEIKKNPAIIAVGFQNDVRPYFAVSHCLVFPSYREGFPNVPMQAGALGLPSIVTDINGCNEIITPELNGLIIPPKSKKALEEAMLRILEQPELAGKLAGNARESIVSRFDQLTLWKLIKAEYDEQLRLAGIENE